MMFVEPSTNAFRGAGVIIITLPWSLIFSVLVDSFTPLHFLDSSFYTAIMFCLSVAINIVLLFFLCRE